MQNKTKQKNVKRLCEFFVNYEAQFVQVNKSSTFFLWNLQSWRGRWKFSEKKFCEIFL